MSEFQKLVDYGNGPHVVNKRPFLPIAQFKRSTIETVLDFAYAMTFGDEGEHRAYRSGGAYRRKNGEIFADAFQGKLSEFSVYNYFYKKYKINVPSLDRWERGKWDDIDLIIDNRLVTVKSTKSFGQLMLLETKDWNEYGQYIPNLYKHQRPYDYFVLVRINPNCSDILRNNRLLYSDEADISVLRKILVNEVWEYDIPGFITIDELKNIINEKHIICRGEMLNGRTKMDASNYYVQAGDMHPISDF